MGGKNILEHVRSIKVHGNKAQHLPSESLLQELVDPSLDSETPNNSLSVERIIKETTARVLSITFGAIDPTTVAFS